VLPKVYIAPRKPTLRAAADTDYIWRTEDSTSHQDDASKEVTTQPRHRRPIRRLDLGFPPVLEAGKHGQRHDDASKKVTAPTGVAVVSFMQGIRPGPAIDSRSHRIRAEKSRLWHTNEERRAKSVKDGAGSVDRRLTTTKRGLDGEYPARCYLTDCHHGAQPSAPIRLHGANLQPRAQKRRPAQAHLGRRRTGAPSRNCRAPSPRGNRTSTAAAECAHRRDPAAPRCPFAYKVLSMGKT
jgi:hypothetical protein